MGDVDAVLRGKYGISEREIWEIVRTSKSQPEAIRKLRMRLHGSTRYDPKYHEVEQLASLIWQARKFSYIPETHKLLKEYEESIAAEPLRKLRPGEWVDAEGRIHHAPRWKRLRTGRYVLVAEDGTVLESKRIDETVPKPRPLKRVEIIKNTGIKTVPKPQPRPSTVVRRITATSTAVEVHGPEQKKLPDWILLVAVLGGIYIARRLIR